MSLGLVANRYAKALLQIALKEKSVTEINQALHRFTEMQKSHSDLSNLIQLSIIHPKKKAQVVDLILEKSAFSVTFRHFVQVVTEAGRLPLLSQIQKRFNHLVDEREGCLEAKVSSAHPLTEDQKESLIALLSKRTGKKVRLACDMDPRLVGGLKVQVNSTIIDASIVGLLNQMKLKLLAQS
jgi:F-type H+-transporting ATPase subunit delta